MREIILGGSSKIWRAIAAQPGISERFLLTIGHTQLKDFNFTPQDRVWVFAYSRLPQENAVMLAHLLASGLAEIVYISSSSTIISSITDCYEYPRAKRLAEKAVAQMPNGKVLTLGLVVSKEEELPSGVSAATTVQEIANFMLEPKWSEPHEKLASLIRIVERPFRHGIEKGLYRFYGLLMQLVWRKPCLLRPLDLVLSFANMRWYGYTFLSNRLWEKSAQS